MSFGKIIKELRLKHGMTQESLAASLNISPQAVSRWETGLAMPDISLLPPLANMFDVSTDTLLGVDITKKQEKIQDIITKADEMGVLGYSKEAVDILRDALREYPNTPKLRQWLMDYLFSYAAGECSAAEKSKAYKEIIELGEALLAECTDDEIRHSAIQLLCYCYPEVGEIQKAEKLAESMPPIELSGVSLRTRIYSGRKRFDAKRFAAARFISNAIWELQYINTKDDDGTWILTPEEELLVLKKAFALIDILCEDGDIGEYSFYAGEIHRDCFALYCQLSDRKNALYHLEKAVELATEFDKHYNEKEKHTSLLLRGDEYGGFSYNYTENQSLLLLKYLKGKPYYNDILNDPHTAELCRKLEENVATR